jgi:hypothetical protein
MFLIACGGPSQSVYLLFVGICSSSPHVSLPTIIQVGVYFPAYTNIVVDIIFSLIPIPMLLQTTLDRKQKITVSIYLALSTIGSICAVGQICYTRRHQGLLGAQISDAQGASLFNSAELASYIIGGCIATYRPILKSLGRRLNTTVLSNSRTKPNATDGSSFLERSQNRKSAAENRRSAVAHYDDIERDSAVATPTSPTSSTISQKGAPGCVVPYSPIEDDNKGFQFDTLEMDEIARMKENSAVESNDANNRTGLRPWQG